MKDVGIRRENGATLVEAALVIPIVVLLLMGVVDFARAFLAEITLNNAVSEGALYAAQFPDDHTKTRQRVIDAGADLNLEADDIVVTCPIIDGAEHINVEAETDVEMLTFVGQWFASEMTLVADSTSINTQSAPCDPWP